MRKALPLLALAGAVLTAACSDTTGSSGTPQFSRQITFPDLKNTLQGLPVNGAARAKVELPPTGLIAREVKVQDPQDVNSPERVESRITDVVLGPGGDHGTLTLEPGFQVSFTQNTKFAAGEAALTLQQFVDQVNAALASNPKVLLPMEADRSPATPLVLGPGDPFPAARLELKDGVGGPELHLNITSANLVEPGTGDCTAAQLGASPLACFRLLGLTVGLDNTTELEAMLPGVVETKFEGVVDCATLIVTGAHAGSFSLVGQSGTIEVVATTKLEMESGDDEKLADLTAVQTACNANPPQTVQAEGEGIPGMSAGAIEATEVEFEVEQQEQAQEAVEFKGLVSAVDLDHRTVTVAGEHGTVVVHIAADALIETEGDFSSLQAVSEAISAVPPQQVEAEGHATAGSSGMLDALDVRFTVEH